MHIIQILLPLYNNDNKHFPSDFYSTLRKELTEKFGGITTYSRSPARGLWKENDDKTVKDDIIIYEIMTDELNVNWWREMKQRLEKSFQQDEIIFRSWEIRLI